MHLGFKIISAFFLVAIVAGLYLLTVPPNSPSIPACKTWMMSQSATPKDATIGGNDAVWIVTGSWLDTRCRPNASGRCTTGMPIYMGLITYHGKDTFIFISLDGKAGARLLDGEGAYGLYTIDKTGSFYLFGCQ